MTKETQTQAIAEPFKFKNAALLNRLSEMAQVPYYATACHTLIQAEMAIVELERENATLRAEVERLAAQAAPTEIHADTPRHELLPRLRRLASDFQSHPLSRSISECEEAGIAMAEAAKQIEMLCRTRNTVVNHSGRMRKEIAALTEHRDFLLREIAKIDGDPGNACHYAIEAISAVCADLAEPVPPLPEPEPTYTDDLELRYAEVCEERDHLRAVLRAQSPAQAPVQPVSLTDVLQAAAPTEIADALAPVVQAGDPGKYDDVLKPFFTLMERELHANSGKGDRPGWLAMKPDQALLEVYHHVAKLAKAVRDNDGPGIMEYGADVANMAMMVLDLCGSLAWVDAYRASSGAAQAVRMLTPREIELLREIRLHAQFGLNEGWQREARNLLLGLEQYYRTIPADGKIGSV